MKGILLLSHGNMAKGMLQTSSVFFGDNYEQIQALDFQITDSADEFEEKIGNYSTTEAIEEMIQQNYENVSQQIQNINTVGNGGFRRSAV